MLKKTLLFVAVISSLIFIAVTINPGKRPSSISPETANAAPPEKANKPGLHSYTPHPADAHKDPYAPLSNGRNAMTQAAFEGDRERLEQLYLQTTPHNFSKPDSNGDNALVAAVAGGQHSLASDLIERGVLIDHETFKRLSATLKPDDTDEIIWWLRNNLPFADPQILQAAYDPSDSSQTSEILAAGYRPTQAEATEMLQEYLSGDALFQLYSLYPEQFSQENVENLLNPIDFASASPRQRLLIEALFSSVRYTEDDSWDFFHMLKKLPYDLVITHPDYAIFGPGYVDQYCDSDDPTAVVLFDQGIPCASENPFGEAVGEYNYALVQRYIDSGINPQTALYYGITVMERMLEHTSDEHLEMAKLLIDNGAATQEQINRFYTMVYSLGSRFNHYLPYPNLPLKLAASPQDDLYVLLYSNTEKRYQLSRQDTTGTILWEQTLDQGRFFNILDNPAGLYFNNGKLLLAQNRFLDGRQKTRLTLFSEHGEPLQQTDILGVFESLVIHSEGYALTTSRTTVAYDNSLTPVGNIATLPEAFVPAVPVATVGKKTFHRFFTYDLQKQDYYPDRTMILFRPEIYLSSSEPPRIVSRYLASILSTDGEMSNTALIGSGDLPPIDYAVSDSHAYIILAGPEQVVIQKRSDNFEIKTFHYLDLDQSPFSTTVDSMSCDTAGCTILGEADNMLALIRTIPGTGQQTLSTTNVRHETEDKPGWLVARNGEQDFVSGTHQLLFKEAQPFAKGDTILLDHTEGLLSGAEGKLYAYGTHRMDAAYEVLDSNGDLLGHYQLDFGYVRSTINAMQQLPDGTLLVTGHLNQYNDFFRTFAALLSPQGEQIWSRIYDDMDAMHGLLTDPTHHLFYTIDSEETLAKLSLQDGSLISQLKSIPGLDRLLQTPQGRIIGLGRQEQRYGNSQYDKINQPVLFCLSPDEASFSASLIGEAGDIIAAAAPWKDGLVAAYIKDADSSANSNAVLARIDADSCQIYFDWKP